jgi:hypothetical protein
MLVDIAEHRITFQEWGGCPRAPGTGKPAPSVLPKSPVSPTLCPVTNDAALGVVKVGNIACVLVKCTPFFIKSVSARAVCSLTIPGRSPVGDKQNHVVWLLAETRGCRVAAVIVAASTKPKRRFRIILLQS